MNIVEPLKIVITTEQVYYGEQIPRSKSYQSDIIVIQTIVNQCPYFAIVKNRCTRKFPKNMKWEEFKTQCLDVFLARLGDEGENYNFTNYRFEPEYYKCRKYEY
jgi:hypothetical protein